MVNRPSGSTSVQRAHAQNHIFQRTGKARTGRNENDSKNQRKQRVQELLQELCDHEENFFFSKGEVQLGQMSPGTRSRVYY